MAKPPKNADGAQPNQPPSARRNAVRDVGSLLPDVGAMAFRRFGFVQGALLSRWRDVVGPVYARWSVPEALRFPRGSQTGGTLTIRVEGPFAVQLQHVAPQIVDRANRILGHGAVARLKIVQGEVPAPSERPAGPLPPVGPAPPNVRPLRDDGIAQALDELAARLAAGGGPPKIG